MIYVNCYKCGEPGHVKRDCPSERSVPASALASPALEEVWPPRVAPYDPPDPEVARRNAEQIRAAMGWSEDERARQLRELALKQVEESRASRV